MSEPTPEDLERDLVADLETCEAASPDPWSPVRTTSNHYADYVFAKEARNGWPAAIRRALAAEAEVARLQVLAAYLAGELSSGQAGRLLGVEDVVDLREMAAAVIDAAGERWRVWREANPPERV